MPPDAAAAPFVRILIVEGGGVASGRLQRALQEHPAEVLTAENTDQGLAFLARGAFDLVMVSASAADLPETVERFAARAPDAAVVAIADSASDTLRDAAVRAGAIELLPGSALDGPLLWPLLQSLSQQAKLQEQVREGQERLEQASRDFQEFAHIVSHDLKSPLAVIVYAVAILEQIQKQKLPVDSSEYLERASRGAKQMGQYIDDVLTYARIESRGEPLVPTSAESALAEALAQLDPAIASTSAKVTHNPLPTVSADPAQLQKLFAILLDNALKFAGDRPPRAHISAERAGNEWTFCVQDEGIGFDPKHAQTVFTMFKRLSAENPNPGTGASLAIAKRIATRHRGRIWAESTPGEGSRFYFTLPAAEVS